VPADAVTTERAPGLVIARVTARRAVRSAAIWGLVFGGMIANEALTYRSNFPTVAARRQFAATFGRNDALAAVVGPARHTDTVGGFVAWRVLGLLIIVGAVWGLLTATRLTRGEEDAGRFELLLAGRTTRARAAGQALLGLAAGYAVLWVLTAAGTLAAGTRAAVGFSVTECLLYATAATGGAALFLAIGALCSQVPATRRQANGLAAALFASAYLIRLVADSAAGRGELRWLSPLGWIENVRPLTGSQPAALVPVALLIAAAAVATIALAGRRDVAAGAVAERPSRATATRLLDGPAALVVRLERWVAVAWVAGLGMAALLFGVVARAAAGAGLVGSSLEHAVHQLGGDRGGPAAWIGYELLYAAALVAFAASTQVAALREEEAEGHLDHLLARSVSRTAWLAGRVAFAAAFLLTAGVAIGVGAWLGLGPRTGAVGLPAMLAAGVSVIAPGLLVLGVGTLLFGLVPRLAVPLLYGYVLWSFAAELIGTGITTNHLVLDTSVLTHVGPAPAADVDWAVIVALVTLGALFTAAGVAAFRRRDLTPA
jgi:ABC-2 type transport system permease protein